MSVPHLTPQKLGPLAATLSRACSLHCFMAPKGEGTFLLTLHPAVTSRLLNYLHGDKGDSLYVWTGRPHFWKM